jgi:hypothetical protein
MIVPIFVLVIGIGTLGYLLLEDEFGLIDAFY